MAVFGGFHEIIELALIATLQGCPIQMVIGLFLYNKIDIMYSLLYIMFSVFYFI
ncbi:hypothetical protein PAECIP111891_05221 [Paenibacillus allorhizoplanae]|uniref:Uncharacterized protein n=1 Tax=Paenibacillus allorhizoplanae TaxID=2905648 RepID=A0ABN8H1I4_9BACL|nr:hypothetical protein PAECIP111891_05221 [Paenibacillus allorhizoplanae]